MARFHEAGLPIVGTTEILWPKKKKKRKRICTEAFGRAHHTKPINSKPVFSFFIS
jgi:hypothetical protein